MSRVEVLDGDLEKALKRLKRKIKKDGLLKELKEHEYYVKPSAKKRKKKFLPRPQQASTRPKYHTIWEALPEDD